MAVLQPLQTQKHVHWSLMGGSWRAHPLVQGRRWRVLQSSPAQPTSSSTTRQLPTGQAPRHVNVCKEWNSISHRMHQTLRQHQLRGKRGWCLSAGVGRLSTSAHLLDTDSSRSQPCSCRRHCSLPGISCCRAGAAVSPIRVLSDHDDLPMLEVAQQDITAAARYVHTGRQRR